MNKDDNPTLGTLSIGGDSPLKLATIELPWRDNQPGVSCIPAGVYECEKVDSSPAFNYQHIHVKDVPQRAGIKIHVGNYARQLQGCIAPGLKHADIDGDGLIDVTSSRAALDQLLAAVPDKFTLEIYG